MDLMEIVFEVQWTRRTFTHPYLSQECNILERQTGKKCRGKLDEIIVIDDEVVYASETKYARKKAKINIHPPSLAAQQDATEIVFQFRKENSKIKDLLKPLLEK